MSNTFKHCHQNKFTLDLEAQFGSIADLAEAISSPFSGYSGRLQDISGRLILAAKIESPSGSVLQQLSLFKTLLLASKSQTSMLQY